MARPIFDVANDNRAPELLDDPIFEFGDDDSLATERKERTPEERAAGRARAAAKRKAEASGMALAAKAIAQRQKIGNGWDGAANQNEDFPLLAVLRRDGADHYVRLLARCRAIVALCAAQPLQGMDFVPTGGVRTDHKSTKLRGAEEVDAAVASGFNGAAMPGGEIYYREARKARGGTFSLPAKRAVAADDETRNRTAPLSMKFTDSVLLWAIDAKPILAELRASLGPLLDPFEDAALGGKTLAEIGRGEGIATKPEGAGRALVFRAMDALNDAWHDIAVRERRLAAMAERNVERKRAELAERRRVFFHRAA